MEEDKDVVEGGAEFVGEHFKLRVGVDHREDELLEYGEAFACEPDDVVVELLHALGVSGWIEAA